MILQKCGPDIVSRTREDLSIFMTQKRFLPHDLQSLYGIVLPTSKLSPFKLGYSVYWLPLHCAIRPELGFGQENKAGDGN